MTKTNASETQRVSFTHNFDWPHHWVRLRSVREGLTSLSDRELFDMCTERGADLYPWALHEYMGETLTFTPDEIERPLDWTRAMELVREQALDARARECEEFGLRVEEHLAHVNGRCAGGTLVDITEVFEPGKRTGRDDVAGRKERDVDWVTCEFGVADVIALLGNRVDMTSMTFEHDGHSPTATLRIIGPDLRKEFTLDFASDPLRDALAHHHYNTVLDGREGVVGHLNRASQQHCEALSQLASTHPDVDLWALERILSQA